MFKHFRPDTAAGDLPARSYYLAAVVLLLVAFVVAPGNGGTAFAGEVASSAASSSATDKIRCALTWSGTSPNATVRYRCNYDVTGSTWPASTDRSGAYLASPHYLYGPGASVSLGGCTVGTQTMATGPQSAGDSPSGSLAIPVGSIEGFYTLTGANCFNVAYSQGLTHPTDPRNSTTQAMTVHFHQSAPTVTRDTASCTIGSCTLTASGSWPAYPVSYYPGGAPSSVPFCGAVVTSTSHTASSYIARGDVVTFSTSWTTTRTGLVEVLFPGSTRWHSVYVPGSISNPSVVNVTVDIPPLGGGYSKTMAMVEMRCRDETIAATLSLKFGSDVDDAGDGRGRPCDVARLYWPANKMLDAGDVVQWEYSYSGLVTTAASPTTLDIEYANWDSGGTARIEHYTDMTWTNAVNDVALGALGSFTLTAGYAAPTTQFVLRCVDYLGPMYSSQWTAGVRLVGNNEYVGEQSCYVSTGFTIYPSSWVPGLTRMGSCVLQTLFVPSDSAISGLQDEWGNLTGKPPVSFIAEGSNMFVSFWSDAESAAGSHSSDALVLLPASTADGRAMPAGSINLSSEFSGISGLSTARTFMVVMLWAGWLWSTFWIVKRAVFK